MITQEEIDYALQVEKEQEIASQNDTLEFIDYDGKEEDATQSKSNKSNKHISNQDRKVVDKIDLSKTLEEEDEDLLELKFDNLDNFDKDDLDKNINEEEDYSIISVASLLNDRLNLGFDINEETIKNVSPDKIFDTIIEEIKDNAINEYKKNVDTYKTEEGYLLDVFLSNGGSIDDFFEYYSKQKNDLNKFDEVLEEIKSYSPEQVLYASLSNDGFSDEEALDYIDKLNKKGALEDEYEKELKKIERIVEKNKSEQIRKNIEDIAKAQREQRIREYEEIENSKTEIASYLSKIDNFAGFNLDENKKERLFNFITYQDEDGYTAYDRYLQSNDNLLIQAIFALYGSDIIKAIETNGNERGKKNFFSKLPSSPFIASKRQNIQQVNLEKLNEF